LYDFAVSRDFVNTKIKTSLWEVFLCNHIFIYT
jgi:hypothetical protein